MKTFVNTTWIRSGMAACLALATFIASSMIVLASPEGQPVMGELVVSGATGNEAGEFVTVDGNRAVGGFTVHSATTIATPATASAIINLGKAGRIEIAPNSSINLNFDGGKIGGTLNAGKVKVFNAPGVETQIKTSHGLVSGEQNQSNLIAVNLENGATNAVAEVGSAYLNNGKGVTKVGQTGQTTGTGTGMSTGTLALVGVGIVGGLVLVTMFATGALGGDDDELSALSGGSTTPTR